MSEQRVACGWLDQVSTPLHRLMPPKELRKLGGALSLAAAVSHHPSFRYDYVYVNVTKGQLSGKELLMFGDAGKAHHLLKGRLNSVFIRSDGTGLLFISTEARGQAHGRAFMKLVQQAFAELQFETKFTGDNGHVAFAAMQ
jgi:hypothetical protein